MTEVIECVSHENTHNLIICLLDIVEENQRWYNRSTPVPQPISPLKLLSQKKERTGKANTQKRLPRVTLRVPPQVIHTESSPELETEDENICEDVVFKSESEADREEHISTLSSTDHPSSGLSISQNVIEISDSDESVCLFFDIVYRILIFVIKDAQTTVVRSSSTLCPSSPVPSCGRFSRAPSLPPSTRDSQNAAGESLTRFATPPMTLKEMENRPHQRPKRIRPLRKEPEVSVVSIAVTLRFLTSFDSDSDRAGYQPNGFEKKSSRREHGHSARELGSSAGSRRG